MMGSPHLAWFNRTKCALLASLYDNSWACTILSVNFGELSLLSIKFLLSKIRFRSALQAGSVYVHTVWETFLDNSNSCGCHSISKNSKVKFCKLLRRYTVCKSLLLPTTLYLHANRLHCTNFTQTEHPIKSPHPLQQYQHDRNNWTRSINTLI